MGQLKYKGLLGVKNSLVLAAKSGKKRQAPLYAVKGKAVFVYLQSAFFFGGRDFYQSGY